MTNPSLISLFTGAGGLDLGLHAAGFCTKVAVEMDSRCCETLRANSKRNYDWKVIQQPIESVSSSEILTASGLRKGEADLLVGGPPCQPFSKSGFWARGDSGRLRDPRANTLREYLRVLEDTLPKAFVLENVAGLRFSGKEEGYRFIMEEIHRINSRTGSQYSVHSKVLNTAWYGVPQTRERIFLVASRDGLGFKFPDQTHYEAVYKEDLCDNQEPYRTAWDSIGDLGEPDDIEDLVVRGRWGELLPSIPEGQNYLFHTERGAGLPLFGWRRRYWSFLLKLAKNRPSWTITAQPGPAIGPFHWNSRRLSPAELARLQTFPDNYIVTGSLADIQKQIGNAVPSLMGEILGLEIRRQLLGHQFESGLSLLPPRRELVPPPAAAQPVHSKYIKYVGVHSAHPGTGLGYSALHRRSAA